MNHPIFSNKAYIIIYFGLWFLCATGQSLVFHFKFHLDASMSFIDCFSFWGLFSVVGLSLWFLVYYNNLDKKLAHFVIFHIIAAIASIAIVIFMAWLVAALFLGSDPAYKNFFAQSIFVRGIIGTLAYIAVILFYYTCIFYQNSKDNKKMEETYKNLLKEAELKSLKSQINPHFLFNSLNSISSQTMFDPGKAQEMIIKLSDYLRFSLSHKPDELIPLKKELENISRYLDIEKVRFGARLAIAFNVDEHCLSHQVPTLILQPLFENAIKYGVHENTEETLIRLNASCDKGGLTVTISNNFDPASIPNRGQGIGLSNIRERLKLLYGIGDLLFINKSADQFTVTLRFPPNHKQV